MENIWGPDRGEFVRAEGSTPFDGPDGPARTGCTLERPARLEEGDMVEAVSRAILRELEGGFLSSPPDFGIYVYSPIIRMGIREPIRPPRFLSAFSVSAISAQL